MWNRADLDILRMLALAGFSALCQDTAAQPPADDQPDETSLPRSAIHATRLDYSEFEVPEAVTVITQEDIRLAGYLDVSEIFRAVPGFRILKIGDASRLSYHGTTARLSRRMLITIDGRSILIGDGQYVEFDRLPIDLEDIARVTITRGPNGAAYGDNAFLASIDFQTIGRGDPRGMAVRGGGGYNGRRKLGVFVNEQVGGFDLAFSAAAERNDGYDYFDSARTPRDDGKDIKRARLALEREFSERSRWRVDTSAYDSADNGGIQGLSFTGEQQNKGHFIALSNEQEIGESSRLDWSVSYNWQREDTRQTGCYTPEAIARTSATVTDPEDLAALLAPTLFVPALLGTSLENTCFFMDLDIESKRSEMELQYESRRGPWRYLLGGSATQIDAFSDQYFAGRAQEQRTYRMFGETALALGPFHASVGAMAQDSSNVDDTELAWRGAINWRFLSNQTLRYSYAQSFRIPSLSETETFWTGAFLFGRRGDPLSSYPISLTLPLVTNSTTVRPETIDAHTIGYFGTFFGSSVTVDVKVFDERIRNPLAGTLFYFSPPPSNGTSFRLNGVESEVSLRLSDRWTVSGQYSYVSSDAKNEIERGLHGNHGGSASIIYQPFPNHAFTAGYYGNSTIAGHSYDRYDLVYNYSRDVWGHLFRSQLIFHHHIGGVDGIRDPIPVASVEGHFAHLNQFFLYLELTF